MGFGELLLLAVGLSMDAFAVSICKGLSMKKADLRAQAICGVWFGGFQALMPLIGFFLGTLFAEAIEAFDHWVAFALLGIIGINMLKEAFSKGDCCEEADADLSVKTMLVMAIATSIDALAVGISLAMAGNVNIFTAVLLIGVITLTLSAIGVKVGNVFGCRFQKKAQLCGGCILVLLGVKILLEHLGSWDDTANGPEAAAVRDADGTEPAVHLGQFPASRLRFRGDQPVGQGSAQHAVSQHGTCPPGQRPAEKGGALHGVQYTGRQSWLAVWYAVHKERNIHSASPAGWMCGGLCG